jgi:serine protease inhibitor
MDIDCHLRFTLDMLQELSASANHSALFSPISLLFALTMAYTGAKNTTRQEFNRFACIKGKSADDFLTFNQF